MSKTYSKDADLIINVGMKPTKERRRQHGGVVYDVIDLDYHKTILVKRYRAVCECPLDAYREMKAISVAEHWVGLKFKEAYCKAVLCKNAAYERRNRITSDADIGPRPGERLLKEAYRTLSPHYRAAVIDICGHDQPARDMAKLDKLKKGLGQLTLLWRTAAPKATEG
jgi:hypothetical protein